MSNIPLITPNIEKTFNGVSIPDLAKCTCQQAPETRISPSLMVFSLARLNFLSMARTETLVSSLGSLLQSAIHLLKAPLRIPIEALRHERNKQARKLLVLNEADPFLI